MEAGRARRLRLRQCRYRGRGGHGKLPRVVWAPVRRTRCLKPTPTSRQCGRRSLVQSGGTVPSPRLAPTSLAEKLNEPQLGTAETAPEQACEAPRSPSPRAARTPGDSTHKHSSLWFPSTRPGPSSAYMSKGYPQWAYSNPRYG